MPSRGRLIGACLLMLLGGLLKHNQVALPLAATLWLACYDRRGLILWLVTAAVAGAAAVAIIALMFGAPFFDQVLHHQRIFDPHLLSGALHSVSYQFPAMVLAILLAWSRPRDPRLALLLIFALLAMVLGIVQRLGVGVSQNAHFDSAIALSILAGIVLARGMAGFGTQRLRLAALAVMIAPLAFKVARGAPDAVHEALAIAQTDAQWRQAIALLRERPGPVACERSALCFWSGKPYALDMSNYGQKMRKGHDPIDLRGKIARREFAAFAIIRDDRYLKKRGRLSDDMYQLINANYRVAQILPDDIYVMVPTG